MCAFAPACSLRTNLFNKCSVNYQSVKDGIWHSAQFARSSLDLHEILKWVSYPVPLWGQPFKALPFSESHTCNMCASPVVCLCESDKLVGYFYWRLCFESSEVRLEQRFAIWDAVTIHRYPFELAWIKNIYKPLTCTLTFIRFYFLATSIALFFNI